MQRSILPVLNKATYRVAECSPDLGDGPGHLVCGVMDDLCISNLLFDGAPLLLSPSHLLSEIGGYAPTQTCSTSCDLYNVHKACPHLAQVMLHGGER